MQLLLSLHDNDSARSYINFVLRTIIAIRFAQDYSRWSMDDKKQYQQQMFSKHHKDQIRQIEHQYGGKEKDKLMGRLFKTFKGRHEKVVTARNHTDRLYRIVRRVPIFLFYLHLTCHPVWNRAIA